MKIKKLFKDCGIAYHHVLQLCDGSFAKFLISPYREISESDLIKIPYYRAFGAKAEEADPYIYKLYGLKK